MERTTFTVHDSQEDDDFAQPHRETDEHQDALGWILGEVGGLEALTRAVSEVRPAAVAIPDAATCANWFSSIRRHKLMSRPRARGIIESSSSSPPRAKIG